MLTAVRCRCQAGGVDILYNSVSPERHSFGYERFVTLISETFSKFVFFLGNSAQKSIPESESKLFQNLKQT